MQNSMPVLAGLNGSRDSSADGGHGRPSLADLPGETASLIDALTRAGCRQRAFQTGWMLLEAGEVADHMYVIVQGRAQVRIRRDDRKPLAEVRRGSLVGEMSMVDDAPACAYVVAAEPTTALEIPRVRFWDLVQVSHVFARHLLESLSRRLRTNNQAVERSTRLHEELQREVATDPLTGVFNRRWLDAQLPVWARQQQYSDEPFAFAMVDIDYFKSFNDEHGHLAGDIVLAAVGDTLQNTVRATDAVVRYGGEEFAVALPGAPLRPAVAALERMQAAVGRRVCTSPDGSALPKIQFSAGVVSVKRFEPDRLLARADALLYEAKRAGRNRVLGSDTL